jgi:AAA family ATP:ADP antiporter
MTALLSRLSRALPHELPAALLAFIYFFALLASYYVLRPIRDEMAVQAGQAELSGLFTAVFVSMLVLVPVFGALTARFPRRRLLPWVYAFFVLNLLAFYAAFDSGGQNAPRVARAFFVWVSVFNLFAISVFWSYMADLFDTTQAKRLYGFIAAGGTAGALAGPSSRSPGLSRSRFPRRWSRWSHSASRAGRASTRSASPRAKRCSTR